MNTEKQKNMKAAVIEQMFMWMVIFIGFVWMFFFVLDYATAIRIKDNMDDISKFAARFVSNTSNQVNMGSNAVLITNINNINISKISNVTTGNLNCVIANSAPQNTNQQCIFIVQGTYLDGFLSNQGTNNFQSKTVVYNNTNAEQITCTLNITIN